MRSMFELMVAMILGILFFNIGLAILIHPTVGSTHHGIVTEEICNGASGESYVVVNYNGTPRSYRTDYPLCLEFLTKDGAGVTITDDAWFNRIASYRFD